MKRIVALLRQVCRSGRLRWIAASLACFLPLVPITAAADTIPATMLDPALQVSPVLINGISQPIGIVFLGSTNDYLVLEKASGQIKRVTNGVVQGIPVLDLAVNSNSERGLLSMVLHPNFPSTPFAYVRWTESSTGADSAVVGEVPLLGNRVDRFVWNGVSLTLDRNLIRLRSRQTDNVPVPSRAGSANLAEAATITAACCASDRTASCTCSWATRDGEAGCRTFRTVRSSPRPRWTTRSAGRAPTTPI